MSVVDINLNIMFKGKNEQNICKINEMRFLQTITELCAIILLSKWISSIYQNFNKFGCGNRSRNDLFIIMAKILAVILWDFFYFTILVPVDFMRFFPFLKFLFHHVTIRDFDSNIISRNFENDFEFWKKFSRLFENFVSFIRI